MVKVNVDEQLIAQLFDSQVDSVVWYSPVFADINDNTEVLDFEARYANLSAAKLLRVTAEDIIGGRIKNTTLLNEMSKKLIFDQCLQVWMTGAPIEYNYFNSGLDRHLNVQRSKIQDGILSITRDRTKEIKVEIEKENQAKLLQSVTESSPLGIMLYHAQRDANGTIADFLISSYNQRSITLTGFSKNDVDNQTLKQLANARGNANFFKTAVDVVETGEPFEEEYFSPIMQKWLQLNIIKFDDGIVLNYYDITRRKQSEEKVEEQREELNSILNAALNPMFACNALRNKKGEIEDLIFTKVNVAFTKHINKSAEETEGKRFLSFFPKTKEAGVFDSYVQVINAQKNFRSQMHYDGEDIVGWFDVSAVPKGKDGLVVTFTDITRSKQAADEIAQQKRLLDNLLKHSPSGISVIEAIRNEQGRVVDFRSLLVNDAAATFTGFPKEELLAKTSSELNAAFAASRSCEILVKILETGEPDFTQHYIMETGRWIEGAISKMDDKRLICIITDITLSKENQLKIEESANKLRTVINTSQAGFFLASPVTNEEGDIVDFRFTLVNQVMAGFVDKDPSELIGQLGSDWFVLYKKNGLFDTFKHTYLSGERQQFDVHYLGETVEVWANVMTTRIGNELLGSFTDFTPVKKLQLELQKSVEELKRLNANLEEFAYASSHDLQEPLRKVTFFAENLRRDLSNHLNDDNKRKFDRMLAATDRMRNLIQDLLAYSQVSVKPDVYEEVELSEVVESVMQDLETVVSETGATITIDKLPQVRGDERQLRQMFQNLVGNAIKYRKLDVTPTVSIQLKKLLENNTQFFTHYEDVIRRRYWLIEIADNGIGFEQQYAKKIFQVFQRLHGRADYQGTGVGLAIVQKVATNHDGYVIARSEPGIGSTFSILLPF